MQETKTFLLLTTNKNQFFVVVSHRNVICLSVVQDPSASTFLHPSPVSGPKRKCSPVISDCGLMRQGGFLRRVDFKPVKVYSKIVMSGIKMLQRHRLFPIFHLFLSHSRSNIPPNFTTRSVPNYSNFSIDCKFYDKLRW